MKGIVTGVLFLGLAILHIWLGRIEHPISYVSPLVGAFIFSVWVGGFKGFSEPWFVKDPTDSTGKAKFANLTKVSFAIMAICLYGCSFIDRG